MAGIDDRAAGLNRRLAERDDSFEHPEPEPAKAKAPRAKAAARPRAKRPAAEPEPAEAEPSADTEPEPEPEPEPAAAAASGSGSAAGLLLGLLAYSVVIQYVRGGTAQVRGWLKAKALNQPYTPAGTRAQVSPGGRGQSQSTA